MKNRRHICNAKDAGYIEYPGLPGRVKTGCMRSPQYKSRYCSQHQVLSCVTEKYEEISVTEMDKYEHGMQFTHSAKLFYTLNTGDEPSLPMRKTTQAGEPVVEILLQKKELRNKTYYKVN